MDKELQKWMFRQFFIRAVILILVAIVISVVCISLKQQSTASQMKKLDKIYMNKYSLDLSALDFLDKREQEQYKKKFIQACEAYNLKQVTKIVIDEGSITYDKETNMYEWTIHCNDEKQTSFLSAYKKTTKDFTVERQYPEEEQSVEEMSHSRRKRKHWLLSQKEHVAKLNILFIRMEIIFYKPKSKKIGFGKNWNIGLDMKIFRLQILCSLKLIMNMEEKF